MAVAGPVNEPGIRGIISTHFPIWEKAPPEVKLMFEGQNGKPTQVNRWITALDQEEPGLDLNKRKEALKVEVAEARKQVDKVWEADPRTNSKLNDAPAVVTNIDQQEKQQIDSRDLNLAGISSQEFLVVNKALALFVRTLRNQKVENSSASSRIPAFQVVEYLKEAAAVSLVLQRRLGDQFRTIWTHQTQADLKLNNNVVKAHDPASSLMPSTVYDQDEALLFLASSKILLDGAAAEELLTVDIGNRVFQFPSTDKASQLDNQKAEAIYKATNLNLLAGWTDASDGMFNKDPIAVLGRSRLGGDGKESYTPIDVIRKLLPMTRGEIPSQFTGEKRVTKAADLKQTGDPTLNLVAKAKDQAAAKTAEARQAHADAIRNKTAAEEEVRKAEEALRQRKLEAENAGIEERGRADTLQAAEQAGKEMEALEERVRQNRLVAQGIEERRSLRKQLGIVSDKIFTNETKIAVLEMRDGALETVDDARYLADNEEVILTRLLGLKGNEIINRESMIIEINTLKRAVAFITTDIAAPEDTLNGFKGGKTVIAAFNRLREKIPRINLDHAKQKVAEVCNPVVEKPLDEEDQRVIEALRAKQVIPTA